MRLYAAAGAFTMVMMTIKMMRAEGPSRLWNDCKLHLMDVSVATSAKLNSNRRRRSGKQARRRKSLPIVEIYLIGSRGQARARTEGQKGVAVAAVKRRTFSVCICELVYYVFSKIGARWWLSAGSEQLVWCDVCVSVCIDVIAAASELQ